MDTHVSKALTRGEQVLYIGKKSLWTQWSLMACAVVLLGVAVGLLFVPMAVGHWIALGAVVCCVGCVGAVYVQQAFTELVLTNKWVIIREGFMHQSTTEVNLVDIKSLQIDQPLLGRMVNFGTLTFAGAGMVHASVAGVADPMAFRRAFLEALEAAQTHSVRGR